MLKLLGVIAALAALVGCGSSDPAPSAATAPTPTPEATPEAEEHMFEPGHSRAVREYYGHAGGGGEAHGSIEAEYHRPPKPATGGVGDAITLTGTNIGVRVRVRLQGLADDVAAARQPRPGKRYVGVRLQLRSTGIAILEDELDNAVLTYGGGRRARAVTGVKAACSNAFHKLLRMDVGNSASGCVLFELPASARPRQFQLALEQVPAAAGGRWIL
jgi:hypothetical protein